MNKAPKIAQANISGDQGSITKSLTGIVAGAAILVGAGAVYHDIDSSTTHREQIASLRRAGTVFKGDIILSAGTHLRSAADTVDADDAGDPSNVKYTVGNGKVLVLVNPVEATDYTGDTWAGTTLPGKHTITSFNQRAENTVWVNLTALQGQHEVQEVPASQKNSTPDVQVTEAGVIVDVHTQEAVPDASTSTEVALSTLQQMQQLNLLKNHILLPPPLPHG